MGSLLYNISSVAFAISALILILFFRHHPAKFILSFSFVITALWALFASYGISRLGHYAELLRNISWIFILFYLLNPVRNWRGRDSLFWQVVLVALILFGGLFLLDIYHHQIGFGLGPDEINFSIWCYQYLLLSIFGLVLIEQLIRNSDASQLWAVKFFCIAIGAQFSYDIFLYSTALLVSGLDLLYWQARAIFTTLLIPLFFVSLKRIVHEPSKVIISRKIVFHGVALIGIGVYMLLMALIGYYIQFLGGQWSGLIQIVFFAFAVLLVSVIIFSGQMRAKLKVFLSKHFFDYKYDYREEWLRFIASLSGNKFESGLENRVIEAVAKIIDSTGGVIWLKNENERYQYAGGHNHCVLADLEEESYIEFVKQGGWVVDIDEYKNEPHNFPQLLLPQWLVDDEDLRLLVPLFHQNALFGVLALNRPRAERKFNWEDHDLLKTVGCQAAGYLALMMLSQELHESRQFEAFNRLSAYVVHDLKNVVSQLSLVIKNAEKYKNNPDFVDDAFLTVDNATKRMNRMLLQLRKDRSMVMTTNRDCIDLIECLTAVCRARQDSRPFPVLINKHSSTPCVFADGERLEIVLAHLVQNAQEATPESGKVELILQIESDKAVISVSDSGCGMAQEYMRSRLFKPFETTKGNAGMGIGAYEAKEYIHSIGGTLTVASTLGEGTVFKISVPVVRDDS
ncbi:Two-component system sensor histidine kinase [hydrothermal vent metagenome]|uniref:Two-component system sensor histidine kinase n=1 Tax=hydrothermal vent metagenome TaxID=652676 RepID=A0A3B0Z6W6_9ZZZZ